MSRFFLVAAPFVPIAALVACSEFGTTDAAPPGEEGGATDGAATEATVALDGSAVGDRDAPATCDVLFSGPPSTAELRGKAVADGGAVELTSGLNANEIGALWFAQMNRVSGKRLVIEIEYEVLKGPTAAAIGKAITVSWIKGTVASTTQSIANYGVCTLDNDKGITFIIDTDRNELRAVHTADCDGAPEHTAPGDLGGARRIEVAIKDGSGTARVTGQQTTVTKTQPTETDGRVVMTGVTTDKAARHIVKSVKISSCD